MKRITLGLLAVLAFGASAQAQVNLANLPPNTVVGRNAINAGPAQALPFAQLPSILFSNTAANTVLAGPTSGGNSAAGFRSLVTADLPPVATSVSNSDGTLTISPTTGAVVASIALGHANNWTAGQGFASGQPWCDVKAKGAVGNGSTDDTAAFNACMTQLATTGGIIKVPSSAAHYCIKTAAGVNLTVQGIILQGDGEYGPGSVLDACGADVVVVTMDAFGARIQDVSVLGMNSSSATHAAVSMTANCVECRVFYSQIAFGSQPLLVNGAVDSVVAFNKLLDSYGTGGTSSIVRLLNANFFFIRNKVDQGWPVNTPSPGYTIAAWQNAHSYTCGTPALIVSVNNYQFQCKTSGTSGGSFPAGPYVYGATITDNTAQWMLVGPTGSAGLLVDLASSSVNVIASDFSGFYDFGLEIANNGGTAPAGIYVTDSTFGLSRVSGIGASAGSGLVAKGNIIQGCLGSSCNGIGLGSSWTGDASILGNILNVNSTGIALAAGVNTTIEANQIHGSTTAISVTAGISDFKIVNNDMGTSTSFGSNTNSVVVASGGGDRYTICFNNTTGTADISDSGTGSNNYVCGRNGLSTRVERYIVFSKGVNFNSANTDTSIPVPLPLGVVNYHVASVRIGNCSASASTATWGLFSAAGGGGTAIMAAGQTVTVTTAAANTNNNSMAVAPATTVTQSYNFTTIFFRIGTAQGSAVTCDVVLGLAVIP